jgi:hypothetical protein
MYNTGTIEVSLNHTLPIPLHYSTQSLKSHVKSSQADLLYSSVLLLPIHSVRVLPPLLLLFNCLQLNSVTALVKVKVKVTLRLMVSQPVSLGVEPHLGLMTRYVLRASRPLPLGRLLVRISVRG